MIRLLLALVCVLVLFVKDGQNTIVTCYRTHGPNITTCEINANNPQEKCHVQCGRKDGIFRCSQDCVIGLFDCSPVYSSDFINLCCAESLCNIFNGTFPPPSPVPTTDSSDSSTNDSSTDSSNDNNQHHIIIAVCVVIVVMVTAIVAGLAIFQYLRSKNRVIKLPIPGDSQDSSDITEDSMMDTMTSGSGSGVPRMIERTIAKQIELQEVIGSGRYGQVYLGDYRDDHVAVKIFSTVDEESWNREKDIYSIVLIRNDNILGYIGADMISNNGVTELWLITQYHPLGSLYDFLSVSDVKLTPSRMILFALSICNGLHHLHTEFSGVQGKPSIAHRDLKSKNILVKTNNTCCIADFGLAVYRDVQTRKINLPPTYKNGTVRYLAPEILNNTIDLNLFDSFLYVDVYCLALVFWEIGLRTGNDEVDDYQVPYYNMVPHDPSFEEMKKVVAVDGQRPPIPQRWANCDVLHAMEELICECWYQDSNARLTVARVKKGLKKIAQDLKIDQI